MKLLLILTLFATSLPVFAQNAATNTADENSAKKQVPANAPENMQKQEAEGKAPANPFKLGPYKDGAYQFWGDEDLKARDKREEESY